MKAKETFRMFICFTILCFIFSFNMVFAAGIKIISPSNGTVVHPKDVITVSAEPVGGSLSSVLLVTPVGAKKFLSSPYTWDITIPDNPIGSISVVALGKDVKGEFSSDQITLNNQTTATLTSLSVSPDKLFFDWPEQKAQLSVTGIYADGTTRSIFSSSTGTIYSSSDTSVATIDSNGLVTAKGNGVCNITISNNGKLFNVSVEVSLPEIVPAIINITPKVLYYPTNDKYIICDIELPPAYSPQDIDISTITLNQAVSGEVDSAVIGDYNNNGIPDLMVKFASQDLFYFIGRGDQVQIAVSGLIKDKYFRGIDIIKVINNFILFKIGTINSSGAYFIDGSNRNSISSTLSYDATKKTSTGYIRLMAVVTSGRVTMQTTAIDSLVIAGDGTVNIKGKCSVNGVAGYSFEAIVKDVANPGVGKDHFSIKITGPSNYNVEFANKTIAGGDIAVSWQ